MLINTMEGCSQCLSIREGSSSKYYTRPISRIRITSNVQPTILGHSFTILQFTFANMLQRKLKGRSQCSFSMAQKSFVSFVASFQLVVLHIASNDNVFVRQLSCVPWNVCQKLCAHTPSNPIRFPSSM